MPRENSIKAKPKRSPSRKVASRWAIWLTDRRGSPFAFQKRTWAAYQNGKSGLIHASTGQGKTYAAWGGPLEEWLSEHPDPKAWPRQTEPLRVLWLTPLRALANDITEALRLPVKEMRMPWTVELRTGDTSASVRQRQRLRFPTALVTTPESLSLLLSHEETREQFANLRAVIVDEWHELMGTKRGTQTELCLARLRRWTPSLKVWGISATLGNLPQALEVLQGTVHDPMRNSLIVARSDRKFVLETLIPDRVERFPWAGHLGLNLLEKVIGQLEAKKTTLLFTNTRSQTELWFKALLEARPDWEGMIALHHGSIDRRAREEAEEGLRNGTLRCVVCTGSLDLGVDFSPVEQVIQVGGPKGVARILQRAGRSGHQPGGESRIVCVPAHALELMEFPAAREAIAAHQIEARRPLEAPLDVLVQHLVTVAVGGGFRSNEMLEEVRSTHAYRNLSLRDWQWTLDFVVRGGTALRAYPQFQRVQERDGLFKVIEPQIARFHRMSIGTISSDAAFSVRMMRGQPLGSVEESFIARLKPGDAFSFSGRQLELVRVRDMTAIVRPSRKAARTVPQWLGGYMPLSSQLSAAIRRKLEEARAGRFISREMKALEPVLRLQQEWSLIPGADELLIESAMTRGGHHYFIYPFAGRLVHEGMAALTAFRFSKMAPRSFTLTMSDYGFALTTPSMLPMDEALWREILTADHLLEDLLECLNTGELARRKFREIARVAGLIFQGYPGRGKSLRQIQASSGLFYDVFRQYDPGNLLLEQAKREVLRDQLDIVRLTEVLTAIREMELQLVPVERLTPLSFPLWAMWVQGQVSSETWSDRVRRMAEQLETEANA